MLETVFGNKTAERVLLYIQNYGEGYGSKIAQTYGISLSQVQKQLDRLESGGVLISLMKGRTRIYQWNPRFALRKQLEALLESALALLPEDEIKLYYRQRMRPRRKGKKL